MRRDGLAIRNSLTWTSKYGSVGVSGYDVGTTDGMNEKGLSANMLWLAESEFGKRDEARPGLCVSQWLQFCLDSLATVDEAVTYFQAQDVQILWASAGDSFKKPLTVHLALGDRTGDSAVIVGRLPEPKIQRQAVGGVLSVMRNVAQPFGTSKADEPNTSQTIWRTVADLTNGVYYFESTTSPNIIWIKLKGLDFSEGAKVQKLDLVNSTDRFGDVTGAFEPVEAFKPLPPDSGN